jgi:type III secretion protein C
MNRQPDTMRLRRSRCLSSSPLRAGARRLAAAGVAAGIAIGVATAPARAALPPMSANPLTITAREQPIQAFLQDLFGRVDLPVDVSPNVHGQVSGSFSGPPQKILRDISRSFGLLTYYDGAVVRVYAAGEITSRALASTPQVAGRVERSVMDAGLEDARDTLHLTPDGGLLATGAPRFVEQVEEFFRAAQAAGTAPPPLGFKVFYLRYAWAQDVTVSFGGHEVTVPGVASVLRSLVTNQTRAAAPVQTPRSTVAKLRGTGLARNAAPGAAGAANGTPAAPALGTLGAAPGVPAANDGGVGQALIAAYGDAARADVAPPPGAAPADASQVRIEVDPRLNAVIVRDAPDRMAQYQELIDALDVEPQSIEIEATIVDIDTTKLTQLGINWRWNIHGRNSILFGRGDSSDLLLAPNTDITPQGQGGFISAVLGNEGQFISRINALQNDGAAKVVSSPQVVTLSNVEAVFDNSQTFFVRVNGFQDVDLFDVTAGTTLRVTPHVFKDDGHVRIKLLVSIEDGSITDQTVDSVPVVERSAVNTQALLDEGESLLIGGLVRQSTNNSVDKVPLLGDLPIVGNLFRTRSDSDDHVERMFLISPRLTRRAVASADAPAVGAPATGTELRPPIQVPGSASTTPAPAPAGPAQ